MPTTDSQVILHYHFCRKVWQPYVRTWCTGYDEFPRRCPTQQAEISLLTQTNSFGANEDMRSSNEEIGQNQASQIVQSKLRSMPLFLILSQTSPGFYVSAVQVFRKHCGKRRNCS